MTDSGAIDALTEDLSYLENSDVGHVGAAKPRFRSALDLNDFFETRTARFEVDNDEMNYFMKDDQEEEDVQDEDAPSSVAKNAHADSHAKAKRSQAAFPFDDLPFDSFCEPQQFQNLEVTEISGGAIKKLIVKEGGGVKVTDSCKVYVHYICLAEGMDEPYDSTIGRGTPHCIDLRSSDVIVGLFLSIKSMEVSEVAKFSIHYNLAFGVVGCPPRIPPSTNIYCIVEVLDIVEDKVLNTVPFMSQEERAALPFLDVLNASKQLRKDGNGLYHDKGYWKAIKKYRKAANVLEEYPVICTEDENIRQELLYTLYTNLAQCYLKVNRPQQACVACQLGFRCKDRQDASCYKLFYRFAEAKYLLGNTEMALKLCEQGLVRDPKNTTIMQQKAKILKKQKEEELISKATYSKMGKAFISSTDCYNGENITGSGVSVVNNTCEKAEEIGHPMHSESEAIAAKTVLKNESLVCETVVDESATNLSSSMKEVQSNSRFTNDPIESTERDQSGEKLPPVDWEELQEYLRAKETI